MISTVDTLKSMFRGGSSSFLPDDQKPDNYVQERIVRSSERLDQLLPGIAERYEMWRSNQYAYVNAEHALAFQPTKTTATGGGKKPWLSRKVNNLLIDIVAHEVSAATQRIPSYEVNPTSADPEKRSAAKISEKVALYGYEQWGIQMASTKAVTHAVVGQEAFAWPYFDTTVGPYILDANGQGVVGRGEIKVKVFGAGDVAWEPGVRFEDSPYHIVMQNSTMLEVVSIPGFLGGPLRPDSEILQNGQRGWGKAKNVELVRVFHYLEKPTKTFPVGRWLVIASGRIIAKERPYPVMEGECLIPLSYIIDPDNDRDMGLVQHLLDPQRIYNDAWNKIVEWKNLALNPQLFVAPGALQGQKITSEPGRVYELADPRANIYWREVPAVPQELFQITQDMERVVARLAAQNDIPSQVEAGKAIQTLIERDQARRQSFLARVAYWHAAVANRGLVLAQEYYTEPRLLSIKGRWSGDVIRDFRGAKILGQTDVHVSTASIEPRTKASMEAKVFLYADRGWITAEQAMHAIEGGYAGDLITSYELDVERIERIIARLKEGPEAMYGTPDNPRPHRPGLDATEAPTVPDYMPRPFDNVQVQRSVIEDWMKTEEYETQPLDIQNIAMDMYVAMRQIEANQAAMNAQALENVAATKGSQNAARSAGPDAAAPPEGNAGQPTPNQPANQATPDRGA